MTAQALMSPLLDRTGPTAQARYEVTTAATFTNRQKGLLAHWALLEEARLTPKPALVDRRSGGAHTDMSLALMEASAHRLAPYFAQMASIPLHLPISLRRQQLGALGRAAEAAMLQATGGINTHRGAIWALGLLVASPGAEPINSVFSLDALLSGAAQLAQTPDVSAPPSTDSHGRQVCRRYQVGGARAQAEAGFPAVAEQGVPVLRASRARGDHESHARLNALLAIMSHLTDTCVLYRAGRTGLETMQDGARAVLEAGGMASRSGQRALKQLDQTLRALNASAGGAADLLAATLLVDRLCPMPFSMPSSFYSASQQELL